MIDRGEPHCSGTTSGQELSYSNILLLGTQFRAVLHGVHGSAWSLTADALLVFGVVLVIRFAWMFTVARHPWRDRVILGWSGMRGALSLAAALSIPASVGAREEILFLTFTTILGTLVVLAIPLPWLLDWLGFRAARSEQRLRARQRVTEAALERLRELEEEQAAPPEVVAGLRRLYESRLGRLQARLEADADNADVHLRLRRELLAAERRTLDELERSGDVDWSSARAIEHQLDLEESGLRA